MQFLKSSGYYETVCLIEDNNSILVAMFYDKPMLITKEANKGYLGIQG
jgi:hypothetical protein